MSTTTTTIGRNGLFTVEPGTCLLGEIITWSCSGASIRHLDLVRALRGAGLDEGVARELAPRHAFTRACRRLARARIIRQVSEDRTALTFRFTAERKEGDRFAYERVQRPRPPPVLRARRAEQPLFRR